MKKATLLLVFLLLISLVTLITGCTQKEAPPTLALGIRNAELCSFVSDEGDYTVQPDATFQRGDVVYLYFEIPGLTVKAVDGKFEIWGKFSELKLFDPNGDMIVRLVDYIEYHDATLDEAPNFGWFYAWYETTEEDIPGQYRFEFMVTDGLSGATGTGSAYFNLQ